MSENLVYIKNSFQQYMDRSFSDKEGNSSKDSLFDAINTFNKKDLAAEYEKNMIRLFNMYCRHVFWSLIQKENDIETIFKLILETPSDMKAFSVFLKVLGNECFITGNKVYIKSYKAFLKKIVSACVVKGNHYRDFLTILIRDGFIKAYQENLIEDVKNDTQTHSQRRIEDYFKTESKASQLMNPFIIVPVLRLILKCDASVILPFVDRLVSMLICVNCVYVGNYELKEQTWELIVSILEYVKSQTSEMPESKVRSLLELKVIDYIFKDFEDQRHFDKEEAEFTKRQLKDSNSANIDGVPRKEIERLMYAKRAHCMQTYVKYHNKEHLNVLIEMLYKLYQINRSLAESRFKFKNNLMSHMDLYSKIIEQGKEGKLNEYLLFLNNKLEDTQQRFVTTTFETNHKEFEGNFTALVQFNHAEKLFYKVNPDQTTLRPGAAILFSTDKEGENVHSLVMDHNLRKENAFDNIYGDKFYMHYPVYPHAIYQLPLNEDSPVPQLIEQQLYQCLERFEEQSVGKFFVTKGNKVYIWKNDQLRRYKDHLDIQQITFGKQCRVILLKNGKIIGEGRNKAKHLVDNENEIGDVKGQEIPFFEKKDKIVWISTFFQMTIAVTERGRVFGIGDKLSQASKIDNSKFGFFEIPLGDISSKEPEKQEEKPAAEGEQQQQQQEEEKKAEVPPAQPESVEMINTETGSPTQAKSTDLFAIRAWTCKSVNTTDFVFLVMVHNLKQDKIELRTLGHSSFGNLGQGVDIKSSQAFKPVDIPVEPRSPDDIIAGYDNTFMVGKDGNLYGWGSYGSEDKHQFKPVQLKYFEKYDIHKISGNQRTIALVSPKDQPNKRLIIYGKLTPFVAEDSVKIFDMFQGLNVYNIQQYGEKLIVSTQGKYQYRKPLSKQLPFALKHEQKCEICSIHPSGLLHFFKDKDNKFHYFCINCVTSGAISKKYQPDIMWVINRPISELDQKPWPSYDPEQLLTEDTRNVTIYLTRTKINGKEFEHQSSLEELNEPSIHNINPSIYVRLSRPLKDDSKIDLINLEQFYKQTEYSGLSINITPDYTFNDQSDAVITKNQATYTEFKKALNEIEGLEEPLRQAFKLKIEEYVAKKIKDHNINELKLKDFKFTEDQLKFDSEKLQDLPEACKKFYLGKYLQYLQYIWGSFTYIYRSAEFPKDFSLLKCYNDNKNKIPLLIKNKILKKLTEQVATDDFSISIHVHRKKAREFFETQKIDEKGEYSIFAQVHKGLSAKNFQGMRINSADKKAWFVKFIGEFALDQGGLFRESLTEMCQELQSHVLNLLIPSQNQKNNVGENRDKWTVNPGATSPTALKMLEFLGALIGMSVRSGILMSLSLPGFVWKQLTDEQLTIEDLKEIDSMTVNILDDLKQVQSKLSEETFMEDYELKFTTILSNGEEVELVPGGKSKKVDYSNLEEYITKTIHARLHECQHQIRSIKKGIDITFQSQFLRLLSWKDLQYKVVGQDVIDVERLKELTVYRNCTESHDTIKKLWKIFNSLSNEDRAQYLKFVWGRTRLPLKEEEVTESHTVQLDEHADVAKLPIGRTCFFRLEIPAYKNEDTFREKLLYAIKNCTVIDADIEGAVHNEEENQAHSSSPRNEDDNDEEGSDEEEESGRRRRGRRDEEEEEEGGREGNGEEEEDGDDNGGGLFDEEE